MAFVNSSKILEILSAYNPFWISGTIDAGIPRDLLPACSAQIQSKEVLVLKGIRRSGKSTLMNQIIQELIKTGIPPAAILRVNLEEPLFAPEYSITLLEDIYRTYRERVYPEGKCWVFLDEVQQVTGWESWVRGRQDTEDIKFFVTGSSASILSREIGTKLTGRNVTFEVFPLSFIEYLRFHNLHIRSELDYITKKTAIRNFFSEYLMYGGFPEVTLKKTDTEKKILLKSYFDDILYRDIISRYQIRDVTSLRNLAVYLLTQIARPTNISKLKNNFTISQDKTESYISALLESYLLFKISGFSYSLKQSMRSGFKPYAIDTGLRNRVAFSFSEDTGWQVENVIACFLRQRYEEVYFSKNGKETDFIVKEGIHISRRIQVWYDDISVRKIPDREITGLTVPLHDDTNEASILLTNDYEDVIERDGIAIRCIPVVKYLLFSE